MLSLVRMGVFRTRRKTGILLWRLPLVLVLVLACIGPLAPVGPEPALAQENLFSGEDFVPIRQVSDPYPVFNGIAVDPAGGVVAMTDVNRKSLLAYSRTGESKRGEITAPLRQIFGPRTNVGFVAGIALDSDRKEILALNNDIEDTMIVLPYDANGNQAPARMLSVPHQAWGLAMSRKQRQLAITVEIQEAVVIYRREARNVEAPVRVIRGPGSGLADPHGVVWDDQHDEITVANHGNYRGLFKNTGGGCVPTGTDEPESGEIRRASITTYSADAKGDAKPLRTIQGVRTHLDFPMGLGDDPANNEFAVANNGDNSVLIFSRTADGNVSPLRVLSGPRTQINRPMGVAIDLVNNELWVSNFIDHSALVFDRAASGNTAPKRIVRSAPAGTPSPGFGNPQAAAYDSKRDQILVPN
jgi:DNA-binding beta-propeller fold protein YncE